MRTRHHSRAIISPPSLPQAPNTFPLPPGLGSSEICLHPPPVPAPGNWNPSPCLTILQHSAVSVCPASTHLPGSGSFLTRTQTWLCSDTHWHHSMGSAGESQCLDPPGITCSSCPRQEDDDPCRSPQHLRAGDYLHNTNSAGARLLSCPVAHGGFSVGGS